MNPILNQSEQLNQPTQNNPLDMIRNMPNGNAVLDMVRGKNPKDVFYAECQRRGVDPNTILNQMK